MQQKGLFYMNVDLMTGGDLSKHMCIDDDRLILIKGEDKTKQVAFWRHDDSNEYVLITYKRYPDKEYPSFVLIPLKVVREIG